MVSGKAIIIGGSLAGLFAANLLRSIGLDIEVFERSESDLSGRGAGLGIRAEILDVLRRIRVSLDDIAAVEVRSRVCLGAGGEIVCEIPIRSMATAWDCLYESLRRSLPDMCYRPGMMLIGFDQTANAVLATFADGTRVDGTLLVGADGLHSTVRKQLFPQVEPQFAGYVAWRCIATEGVVPVALRDTAFHHMNFCFPDGEFALCVPMGRKNKGALGGHRRCQITWFRPTRSAQELAAFFTDDDGRSHGLSISPQLIRKSVIADMRRQAAEMLPPQFAALIGCAEPPILQPIFDLKSQRLFFHRALLLGDAAFVARPHVAAGATKAALDAACLADALLSIPDLDAALASYERTRIAFGARLVERGRYLGAYLTAQAKPPAQRRGRELYRDAATFMREFGDAGATDEMTVRS